jgi:CheY-like chemotaxis protein
MASNDEPVVLWTLGVHGREVRCLRQSSGSRFELRVLMGDEVFLTETFPDLSRLAVRAEEFRTAIASRGWSKTGTDTRETEPAAGPVGTTPSAGAVTVGSGEAPAPAEGASEPSLPAVLVVDDEGAVRSFLRAYLEDAEYKVYEATDVDGALSTLDEARIDAVVLDVRMPDPRGLGRSGLEVLAFIRLRAAFDALPVMILTGRSLEPEEQELIRRHHAHLFLKPDGYRQLLQRLEQLTTRPGTGRP